MKSTAWQTLIDYKREHEQVGEKTVKLKFFLQKSYFANIFNLEIVFCDIVLEKVTNVSTYQSDHKEINH